MNTWPNWLIDLVHAVEQYEDIHLHVKDGGRCLEAVLEAVPRDVRVAAAAVGEYTFNASRKETP